MTDKFIPMGSPVQVTSIMGCCRWVIQVPSRKPAFWAWMRPSRKRWYGWSVTFFYRVQYVSFSHLLCFMRVNILDVFRPPGVWVGRRKHCLGSPEGGWISPKVTSGGSFFFFFAFLFFFSGLVPVWDRFVSTSSATRQYVVFWYWLRCYDSIGGKLVGRDGTTEIHTKVLCGSLLVHLLFCVLSWDGSMCEKGGNGRRPSNFPIPLVIICLEKKRGALRWPFERAHIQTSPSLAPCTLGEVALWLSFQRDLPPPLPMRGNAPTQRYTRVLYDTRIAHHSQKGSMLNSALPGSTSLATPVPLN